jgi:isopentenyl diphosphate isomerase/L-lactate dehydrogenase-like FMN-dependent dehydrogenase
MVASTLTQDRMEDVVQHAGHTPGLFQLYTPNDKDLTASFLARAERAGYRVVVITLDTWTTGWRPRDLNAGNFPQLRGYLLENYFTDGVFLKRLVKPPKEDLKAAALEWIKVWGNSLQWDDLRWLRSLTRLPILLKGIQTGYVSLAELASLRARSAYQWSAISASRPIARGAGYGTDARRAGIIIASMGEINPTERSASQRGPMLGRVTMGHRLP